MSHRTPRSVHQKITAIIFLVSLFVLVLTSVQFAFVELKRMRDVARDDVGSLARLVSANARFAMAVKDYVGAEKVLNSLDARNSVVKAYLFLPNGKLAAAYSRSRTSHARLDNSVDVKFFEIEARQIAEGMQSGEVQTWQEGGRLAHFLPISYEGSHVGYHFLSMELHNLRRQQLYLALGWLLVMGPAVLVTYLLSARLQRQISRPIEQLAARMQQISLDKRLVGFVPKQTDDEFNLLFHGFDEMIRALKERDRMLESHRRDLEFEVQIRTRALESEKEKAELATLAKSRFLANMSHEIRTPMIGVLGMADLLRQRDLAEQDRRLVEVIYRSGEALLAILNDVLDFSKIEAGRFELDSAPVNLARLAEDVTRLMEVNAHAKGLEVVLAAPADLPVVVGDPGRVRQILLNLVGNAIKFTETGRITIAVTATRRAMEPVCDCVLVVRDTGIGIAQEDCLRIFDSFDQGESGMTRKYQGTGLGLSITRELVLLMKGEITVASNPGEGSVFTVHLPMPLSRQLQSPEIVPVAKAGPVAAEAPDAASVAAVAIGKRILLAEDNPATQNLLSILLQQMGIELVIVDNGQAAVDFLAQETVDLIFMDCQMPQMDGLEATALLRARGISTPIIALTAYALAEDEERCLVAGMNDFLSKPFHQFELRIILARWLVTNAAPTRVADSAG